MQILLISPPIRGLITAPPPGKPDVRPQFWKFIIQNTKVYILCPQPPTPPYYVNSFVNPLNPISDWDVCKTQTKTNNEYRYNPDSIIASLKKEGKNK